jgi:hypothetical protein
MIEEAFDGITLDPEDRAWLLTLLPTVGRWPELIRIDEARYEEPAMIHRVGGQPVGGQGQIS